MKVFRGKSPQSLPARRRVSTTVRDERATTEDLDQRYAFRRNRTLTGSLASSVTSVNEHRAELKSPRVHAHSLRRHRRRLGWLLLAVLAGAGLLAAGIYLSIATPVVTAATTRPIDASLYQQKIQQYLGKYPLERSRVTLDTTRLAEYLQTHGCPEVQAVSRELSFAGIGATRMTLEFRRPVVSWQTGANQLYVDAHGYAYERNYFGDPEVRVTDETGIQTKDNQVLASNRFLGFVGKTIGQFKSNGYTVTKITLPANTTRQLHVTLDGVGYPVKVSIDRKVGEQVEDAARAVKYLTAKGTRAEYIDVRVSGKAYYK